ncbi:MAG: LuxR family transcriptional regulator [Proteobacteria bacterium]|nr:MAG: LuxR family transcriptional regulator [Pseudomonadota bacterium]
MISRPTLRALPGLTAAEREVVSEVVAGASNAQIATARGTSSRTVANQLQRIFAKLGVHSRAELAREAATFGP